MTTDPKLQKTPADYREAIRQAVLDPAGFIRLTFSRKSRRDEHPWTRITVRPLKIGGTHMLQVSSFDSRRDVSRNISLADAAAALDELLAMPFAQINIQTTTGDSQVRITKKGDVFMTKTASVATQPPLTHDRRKPHVLDPADAAPCLRAVGILDPHGHVLPGMQAKLRQVQEFLRIITQVVPPAAPADRPLRILDAGCGRAYLTFAALHYLRTNAALSVEATGIDLRPELVEASCAIRDHLAWTGLDFHVSRIADFQPPAPPDVVLSLHACDTATDEAIARGIEWKSPIILAAPCCQHELHDRLSMPVLRPALQHGILRTRLADILTDTFRALILRLAGYRADVIEFIDPDHTSKNLMIRAVRTGHPVADKALEEYRELKAFCAVTPALEALLNPSARSRLGP